MAGTFVVDGENVTITFEYVASIVIAQDTVRSCAKYLFRAGYRSNIIEENFDLLTPNDWLKILDEYILKQVTEFAKYQLVEDAKTVAQETARVEAETKFITPPPPEPLP